MSLPDILLLVLYTVLMLVLTIYSAHAYLMLYLYRKNRANWAKPVCVYRNGPG